MPELGPSPHLAAAALEAFHEGGRPFWLPVRGTSMWPFLREGDQVRVTGARPRLGDLAAFWDGDRVIVHRCAGWASGTTMRQKGDNLRGWSLVPTQRVIGRADRWRRDGRERTQGFWGTLLRGLWAWTLCALWGLARGLRCRLLP